MEQLWKRIFKGADSTAEPNVCKDRTTTGPLGLRQTRREASDPGTYNLTVRACINVAIGTRQACHELTSDGTSTHPHLVVYALSGRGAE